MGNTLIWFFLVLLILGMVRPKYALVLAAIGLILSAAMMGIGWWAFRPNITQTSAPVSREVALKYLNPKILPASAHNIQYYLMYMQMSPGFDICVRCEAPVEDCHAVARDVLGNTKFEPVHQPVRLNNSEIPAWFDVGNISNGVTGGKGYDSQPEIWIDEGRGIFYYYLTD